jgi:hypothetical protein
MTDSTSPESPVPVDHIYRWDLDKTYLKTDFDSLRGLIRTALQKPEDKTNVPGAIALLHELCRPRVESRVMVTFVSGSPTQMRDVLMKKFELDGIEPDVLVLKPTLQNILKGRFKAVRGQVGYKLESLLGIRADGPSAPETLFGDDAEQDAFIYSVYADLVGGRLDLEQLRDILVEAEVYSSPMGRILEMAEDIRLDDAVGRIFINLERRTAPGRFLVFGPRVVPIVNYFQAALVLWSDGVMTVDGLLRVAGEMIERDDYGLVELSNSFQDLLRRRVLGSADVDQLASQSESAEMGALPPGFGERFVGRVRALAPRGPIEPVEFETAAPPDYIEILRADRALKDAVTERRQGLFE